MMLLLPHSLAFPNPLEAPDDMPAAVGGDLSVARLMAAYQLSYFPWFSEGQPILWWSLNPRFVLPLNEVHVSRSLGRAMRKSHFEFRFNTAFEAVIDTCAHIPRVENNGTWITSSMLSAYKQLHRAGHAVSLECWQNDVLVGGLYGVLVGRVFCGESMFTLVPNAGKAALVWGLAHLAQQGYELMDCQMETPHMAAFGGRMMAREDLLSYLQSPE
jgi:leucyl/phenylalanyl-tRNA--protein transferase